MSAPRSVEFYTEWCGDSLFHGNYSKEVVNSCQAKALGLSQSTRILLDIFKLSKDKMIIIIIILAEVQMSAMFTIRAEA